MNADGALAWVRKGLRWFWVLGGCGQCRWLGGNALELLNPLAAYPPPGHSGAEEGGRRFNPPAGEGSPESAATQATPSSADEVRCHCNQALSLKIPAHVAPSNSASTR